MSTLGAEDISFYMKEYAKLGVIDDLSYGCIREETKQQMNVIIDKVEEMFSKEEIKDYIITNFNITTKER